MHHSALLEGKQQGGGRLDEGGRGEDLQGEDEEEGGAEGREVAQRVLR